MKQFSLKQFIIFCAVLAIFILIKEANGILNKTTVKLERGKRYLDFLKSSRMFFRANVKNNILDVNAIFSYAYGFRANYPIENDIKKRKRASKIDIFQMLETFMDRHGFDGKACVLKSFCTSIKGGSYQEGILFKTFKAVLS